MLVEEAYFITVGRGRRDLGRVLVFFVFGIIFYLCVVFLVIFVNVLGIREFLCLEEDRIKVFVIFYWDLLKYLV